VECFTFILFVGLVALAVWCFRLKVRLGGVEAALAAQSATSERRLEALERDLLALREWAAAAVAAAGTGRAAVTPAEPAAAPATAPAAAPEAAVSVAETPAAAVSPLVVATAEPASELAAAMPVATEASASASEVEATAPLPQTSATAASPVPEDVPAVVAAEPASAPASSAPETTPAPVLPPMPSAPPSAATPSPARGFDWEGLVGVRLFSWVAGISLAVAAVAFLKHSVEAGWLQPPVRMAIGLLVGIGLLVVCELKAARRYAVTANALDAAGIAILFATVFASHALWHLLGSGLTFGLMVLITAVAVLLSIRRNALFIALLGLIGGFATPALLATGEDRPIGLFSYLLLLNIGLAWVASRRGWRLLVALSLLLTTLYQWGWVIKFLDAGRLPLALAIFLVFPIAGLLVPILARRGEGAAGDPLTAGRGGFTGLASLGAALPVLFAVHLAVVPGYGERFGLLFGFLFLVVAGLTAIASWRGPAALHVGAGLSTLLVFALWLGRGYTVAAWPGVLGFLALFVGFFLAASWLDRRWGGGRTGLGGGPPHRAWALGRLTAPLLLFVVPVLLAMEPAAAAPALPFGVLAVLLAAIAAAAIGYGDGKLHFLAAFFAVVAEAVWSTRHLDADRLLSGVALYGLFGLFYLGVPIVARRLGRPLRPAAAGSILLLASLGLLFFLAAGTVAAAAVWGLGLLLVVLNAGLMLEAASGVWKVLSTIGATLSWLVIAIWWATTPVVANLGPALFLVGGFALVVLVGRLWLSRRSGVTVVDGIEAAARPESDPGLYLALVGHFFLLFVAGQASLSLPPWPFLGVLAVLDLAIGVAVLLTGRTRLQMASLALSEIVLLVWLGVAASAAPWPSVTLLAVLALTGFGVAWIGLGRRRAAVTGNRALVGGLGRATLPAAFLGQLVIIGCLGEAAAAPGLLLGLPATVAVVVAMLWVVASTARETPMASAVSLWWATPFAVLLPTVGIGVWGDANLEAWGGRLLFVAAVYAPFLAFPLLLGERARTLRAPFVGAVVASATSFLLAREILVGAGFADFIGLLPVGQAFLLVPLLRRLLVLEPAAARDQGRLALVAGAMLALVTVAIPLQLDREWITLGWALLAAALAWLYGRVPHRGLLWWTAGLVGVVFARLAVNPEVLAYHPRSGTPVLNWYLYTYAVTAAAFFLAAWLLRRPGPAAAEPGGVRDRLLATPLVRLSVVAIAAATVLLFLLLNIEIADFFSAGDSLTFGFLTGHASLPEDLAYTLGWAVFALTLFAAGINSRVRAARLAAILLLVVAVLKGFLHDLARLGGLYRVGSFVGLAASLALVAVLIQKFVLPRRDDE
jgi:hypothetical protein